MSSSPSAIGFTAATPDAPRILIVRTSALGDIVFASSLLDALRRRWPRAHIAWLAQSGFAGILDGDPRLDERISIGADVLRSPPQLWKLRRELRARRFDLVCEIQGLFKSRLLAWLAGGYRVGFASKEPGARLMHRLLPKGGDIRDISSEYRHFAEQLTGDIAAPPRLPVDAGLQARVAASRQQRQLTAGFIALCPFTTRPQKHWIEPYWPQLIEQLAAMGRGPCVIFGGPGDREAAARIAAATQAPLLNLAGETRLGELPAWLAQAALVIGVDTGLTHIGIAVGTPTLALFGSTCPYTRLGSDDEARLRVLYDALPCAPCRRHPSCDGRFDCLRGITPARVAAAAAELLRPR